MGGRLFGALPPCTPLSLLTLSPTFFHTPLMPHVTSPSPSAHMLTSCAKALLKGGAELNGVDLYGRTAMHYACAQGQRATCEVLASKGGNVFAADRYGDTPLHLACAHGHKNTLSFVLALCQTRLYRLMSGKDQVSFLKMLHRGHGRKFNHVTSTECCRSSMFLRRRRKE